MYILVIMLIAGTDGGRAINTDLRFKTEAECRSAAEAITKDAARTFNVNRRGWIVVAGGILILFSLAWR